MNKFIKGDKVIPISKSASKKDLKESICWKRAKESGQNYLIVNRIEPNQYMCSDVTDYGDFFKEEDLIKAYTIEDLRNTDIYVRCTSKEQGQLLGKYASTIWLDCTFNSSREFGFRLYKEAGWSSEIWRDNYIEFNQIIFQKEDNMTKKIIGYKLLKDLPDVKAGAIYTSKDRDTWKYDYKNNTRESTYVAEEVKDTTWFKPIYESTKKEFIIKCQNGGDLVIIVENDNITSEGEVFDIKFWKDILNTNWIDKGWTIEPSHLNIGCRKEVPVKELQKVINYYYSINK